MLWHYKTIYIHTYIYTFIAYIHVYRYSFIAQHSVSPIQTWKWRNNYNFLFHSTCRGVRSLMLNLFLERFVNLQSPFQFWNTKSVFHYFKWPELEEPIVILTQIMHLPDWIQHFHIACKPELSSKDLWSYWISRCFKELDTGQLCHVKEEKTLPWYYGGEAWKWDLWLQN